MKRVPIPELEDYPWFPAPLRDALTDYLGVASRVLGVSALAAPLVLEALAHSREPRIVDLCSGAGGPALGLVRYLRKHHGMRIDALLTDKYPNRPAMLRAQAVEPSVSGCFESVDATCVPADLHGVRTIFNAFHHLPPEIARAVLADAAHKRQPILTFEFVERSAQGAALIAAVPATVYAFMPFVRPLRASALALTYAAPLLPAIAAWDGMASCFRAYSPAELEELIAPLQRPDYRFRVQRMRVPGRPLYVTSVVGLPLAITRTEG
jgi:hypothetical protein